MLGLISALWDGSECFQEWMSISWQFLKSEFHILMLLLGRKAVLEIPSLSCCVMCFNGIRHSTTQSLAWKQPRGHATWFSEWEMARVNSEVSSTATLFAMWLTIKHSCQNKTGILWLKMPYIMAWIGCAHLSTKDCMSCWLRTTEL